MGAAIPDTSELAIFRESDSVAGVDLEKIFELLELRSANANGERPL